MLLSLTKNEILYSHYLFAFEQIKKNSNKNDSKYPKIIEICNSLNESKNILNDNNNLHYISLFLVQPLDKSTTKIIDIIINAFTEIMKDKLIETSLLQKMAEDLIIYINKYLDNNEATNLKINQKILNICEIIYSNDNLFIHNNNFITIIEICLKINCVENDNNRVYKMLISFINKMVKNMDNNEICNYGNNKYNYDKQYLNNVGGINDINNINIDKNQNHKIIQLNSFLFFTQKYINYLMDIIEIQSLISNDKNINIFDKYINIIKRINNQFDQSEKISFKEDLESLNLENLNIYYNINEEENNDFGNIHSNNKIGKYGWCILCRKTANNWSEILNFPICEGGSCEKNLNVFLSNIYYKNDYIQMLLFLSKTSISISSNETNKNKSTNIRTTELCLETIKEMLKKTVTFLNNDIDFINVIKEIFKESILKNALSQNQKIFQLSLEIFNIIFNNFKYYLKEQLEIFFMKVFINILESGSRGFSFKEAIIDNLSILLDKSNFLVEIYINYDSDTNRPAIYCVLINLLTKIMNGLFLKPKYQKTFNDIQANNAILVQKSFNILNKFLWYLNELINRNVTLEKIKDISDYVKNIGNIEDKIIDNNLNIKNENNNINVKNIIDQAIEIINKGKSIDECLNYLQKNKIIFNEDSFNKIKIEYINDYNNNEIKEDYSIFLSKEENAIMQEIKNYYLLNINNTILEQAEKEILLNQNINNLLYFIINEKKEKLPELDYNSYLAFEIAYFIRLNIIYLYSHRIKNYLYQDNNFNNKILYYYIHSFNFKDKSILDSLRILFRGLPPFSDEKNMDKIIQIFSEKFYIQNKNQLCSQDNGYYLSFLLIELNNNLHQKENKQKTELNAFIEKVNSLIYGNHKIYEDQLEYFYNQLSSNPFTFLKTENEKKTSNGKENKNYITEINNDNIRKLIDFSCGNFLTIYSQTLNESIFNNNKDLFLLSIEKILVMAKICGVLKLNQAQSEFINTILIMINLNEKDELNENMIEVIIQLMNYINDNCQYIHIGWFDILQLISKLEYYLLEPEENIITNMKNAKPTKFSDKEIKYFINKKSNLALNISDAVCESIFSKTELFDNESIINFITDLCKISKQELNTYFIPRLFSLFKLIEVTHFNIFRIQFIWSKIWKIISEYLIEIITTYPQENIWKQALDSLKITIGKFLEKEDNKVFNFQMEIFKPFEIIFYKTSKIPERGEMVINYIHYLVFQYWKNIHSGWIIIFRLIKNVYQKKNLNNNENIKNILKIIYDNKNIILNNNMEIFNEFMEFLCIIYNDKTMKPFAFEIIVGILSKIINIEENDNNINNINKNNPNILMVLPNSNKIYEYIKIFFYNIDDLMRINAIEYLNLLFEIFNHNKKILLSEKFNIFIYVYFIYFKPHITILLLSKYINRFYLLNQQEEENITNISYSHLTNDNIIENVLNYIGHSLNYLINNFSLKESIEYDDIFFENNKKTEHKKRLIGFLKEIKEEYNSGKNNKYLNEKINKALKLEPNNYEPSLKFLFEKFQNMFCKNTEKNNNDNSQYINYKYFYIDLILTIQQLAIFNNNSDLIYRTLYKIISLSNEITKENAKKLIDNNIYILKVLSNSKIIFKYEEYIYIFIKYTLEYCNYLLDFIQLYQIDFSDNYKLVSQLFNNVLLIELENKFEKYKIVTSSSTVVLLMKIQDIQLFIMNKFNKNNYKEIKNIDDINIIINLNKIYDKYQIGKEENSLINKIYIVELENILPKFINIITNDELEIIYECLTNFICSINYNIRKAAKNLLKLFKQKKLISLNNSHIK